MYGYIYKTTNLISGKIYIGKRVSKWFLPSYVGSGIKLKAAVKSYGKQNFNVELIKAVESEEALDEAEKHYIQLYNSQNPAVGYNIGPGGEGGNNLILVNKRPEYKKRSIEGQLKAFGKKGESMLIHKETITKGIKKIDLNKYLNVGWSVGRYMSVEERRQRIIKAKQKAKEILNKMSPEECKLKYGSPGAKNPRYGKHWDTEHKNKQSATLKAGFATNKYKTRKNIIAIHKLGDSVSIYINKAELDKYLLQGYLRGITEEEALKRRHRTPCKGSSKKLKCIETGEIFNSKKELMQKFNISIATLNNYIKLKKKIKWINLTFEEVKDE